MMTVIVLAALAVVVGLCIRSIVKSHKSGGCSGCKGCDGGSGCNCCH